MNIKKGNRLIVAASLIWIGMILAACGLFLRPVFSQISTGPVQEVDISLPLPEDSDSVVNLNLNFLMGELNIAPGATDSLAAGTIIYNSEDLKPFVEGSGNSQTLSQGNREYDGLPVAKGEVTNVWDLKLADVPLNLNIQAIAYTGRMELGGLSIKNLTINEGGSDFFGSFSQPNHIEMASLNYTTGGSSMVLQGLSNANFTEMNFNSGAGDYTLSFDGDLKRDARVSIESGASTVTIIVPKGFNAVLNFNGGLTAVNNDGWEEKERVYLLSGSGPTLTIGVEMGIGTLNLKTES